MNRQFRLFVLQKLSPQSRKLVEPLPLSVDVTDVESLEETVRVVFRIQDMGGGC